MTKSINAEDNASPEFAAVAAQGPVATTEQFIVELAVSRNITGQGLTASSNGQTCGLE